ncbi:MAG: GtrA family protein [Gallionella sp.]|nr:GtrA family protein [Gallionella sp.]
MHKLKIEFSKFAIVGALNFIFTFILFYIFVKVINFHYLIALMAVSLLGMILTYSLNHVWVFKPEQKLAFRGRLVKYVLSGFLSISLNLVALEYIVEHSDFDPFYVQTALIPFIVIFNFSTARFWSLKPTTLLKNTHSK